MSDKPTVLILGACGFIGRHLVEYLIANDVASHIRIVDKTPPEMAWLNKQHKAVFSSSIVEFISANLINQSSCQKAFTTTDHWDYVFNCAAETRPGQSDAVYNEGITKLSLNCANECAGYNVKRFIELSSGNMYSSEKKPIKEDCVIDPWTFVAKYKAKVEKQLGIIPNLNYTILRLPIVYGKGDRRGLTPRMTIAAIYKYLNDPMKLLWNETIKLNTVHVTDVVAAIWELASNERTASEIYNVVDDSESTQGSISNILAEIFNIKVEYWGTLISSITKVNMVEVIEEINDKHMGPWAELCQIDHIENTPLTPYMDEELLYHKHLYLDNSKLKGTGFVLRHPMITRDLIEEIISDFIAEGLLPRSLKF